MRILDTLSNQKIDTATLKRGGSREPIRLFVCGPTVYDYAHIGNFRTYMAFDIVVRYLRSQGMRVFYLQNITDIDDKIIERAREEHSDWKTVARCYEKIYRAHEKKLGILTVTKHARATAFIPHIVAQIQTLIRRGSAYKTNDGYYFDITTYAHYGKLSRRSAEQAEQGISRIDESIHKHNRGDFALWKFAPITDADQPIAHNRSSYPLRIIEGEPAWHTPLGWGRPGWHIEDTAISEHFFGSQYDIHGGGIDLIFPHHEAEIAQQEAASGNSPLVNIWMHVGSLLVDGKKMSKSLGNFITMDDFLAEFSPAVFRYIAFAHHYRSPLNYTRDLALQAQKGLATIQEFVWRLALLKKTGAVSDRARVLATQARNEFHEAMADDFNSPKALAAFFTLIHAAETDFWDFTRKDAAVLTKTIAELFAIAGLTLASAPAIPSAVRKLAIAREQFRKNQQFIQSDTLRQKLEALGYTVEDTPMGPYIRKISKS